MVELTGVPYSQIMAAALLPAILYFFAVWIGINAYATQHDLKGISADERPDRKRVFVTSAFFMVPFCILLIGMFVIGYTPQYSACLAILASFVMLCFNAEGTFDLKMILGRFENAFINAARQVSMIAAIIVCASIIIGVLSITGLGVKITSLILSVSGGLLWPSLLLTALACLVLGMEVPTTAAYVICVSVAGPALIQLGLDPLQAHLFVFWFALLSTITPPVCGAVFIAAGMIDEDWLKVAISAMALGIGLYIIPLAMIANPDLIQLNAEPFYAVLTFLQVGIGLAALSYGVIGSKSFVTKLGLIGIGVLVIFLPNILF